MIGRVIQGIKRMEKKPENAKPDKMPSNMVDAAV